MRRANKMLQLPAAVLCRAELGAGGRRFGGIDARLSAGRYSALPGRLQLSISPLGGCSERDRMLRLPGWLVALAMLAAIGFALSLMSLATVSHGRTSWHWQAGVSFLWVAYFGWLFALGRSLCAHHRLQPPRGMRLASVGFIASALYAVVLAPLGGLPRQGPLLILLAVPHVIAVVTQLYLLYFASRSLIWAERRSVPRFGEVLPTLLVLFVSFLVPIGV